MELAGAQDDAALRRLLRESTVPGPVSLGFEREPSFFAGCGVMGERVETPLIRSAGEAVAFCCRAIRRLYLDGVPAEIGYLGQLRVAPEQRGRMLVARGMRFLEERDAQDPVAGYFATVSEGNSDAEGVLVTRPRPGFPEFRRLTTLHTLALPLTRSAPARAALRLGLRVRTAGRSDLSRIVPFLHQWGAKRQFFPVLEEADFASERTRGLRVEDLHLVEATHGVVGLLGLWDQSEYKQTVVRGYSRPLALAKPLHDLSLRLRGARPLPRVGERLRYASASLVCVADDDPQIFAALLASALGAARDRGLHYLMVGLCDEDPLLPVARRVPHLAYRSVVYDVRFGGHGLSCRSEGVRHIEIATL